MSEDAGSSSAHGEKRCSRQGTCGLRLVQRRFSLGNVLIGLCLATRPGSAFVPAHGIRASPHRAEPQCTRTRALSDLNDFLLSSALPVKMDLSGLPDWVQNGLQSSGVDVFTYSESARILLGQQLALVFLGVYVSKQRFGADSLEGREQSRSDQIRAERRKRSGLGRPKTLEDLNLDEGWLDK